MPKMILWLLLLIAAEVKKKKEKRKKKRKKDRFTKKLMIPESEISECPEYEVK